METLTTDTIISRIIEHRRVYEERNLRKARKAELEREMEEREKREKKDAATSPGTGVPV